MNKTIKTMGLGTIIGLSALAMAGCQSSDSSSSAGVSHPSASLSSSGNSGAGNGQGGAGAPAGGSGTSSGGGSAGQAASPQCRSNEMSPSGRVTEGQDGQTIRVVLTNTSGRTCHIQGWPGVAWQGTQVADGGKVHSLQVVHTGGARNVVLRPHSTAYTLLTHTTSDDPTCKDQAGIGVSLPGDSVVRWPELSDHFQQFCNGKVNATALAAG